MSLSISQNLLSQTIAIAHLSEDGKQGVSAKLDGMAQRRQINTLTYRFPFHTLTF